MATLSLGWLAERSLSRTPPRGPDSSADTHTIDRRVALASGSAARPIGNGSRVLGSQAALLSRARLDPPRTLVVTLGASVALHVWLAAMLPGAPATSMAQPAGSLLVRIGDVTVPTSLTPAIPDSARQDAPSEPLSANEAPRVTPVPAEPDVRPAPQRLAPAVPVVEPSALDRAATDAPAVAKREPPVARAPSRLPAADASSEISPRSVGAHASATTLAEPVTNQLVFRAAMPSTSSPVIITDPVYRTPPKPPVYPARAVRFGQQGTVMVRAHLSTLGEVLKVELQGSSGHSLLDKAALEAVNAWRFEPARRGGQAVLAVVDLPVNFRLQE